MTPLTILVALSVLAGILAVLWRPQYAVAMVLVMFPLEQLLQSYFPILLRHGIIINAAIAILAAVAVVSRMTKGEPIALGYTSNWTIRLVWVLYAFGWVGLLYSPMPSVAANFLTHGAPYFFVMLVLLPLAIYDTKSMHTVMLALLVAGTAITVLILLNPSASFASSRLTIDFGPTANRQRGNPLALAEMGGLMAIVAALHRPISAGWLVIFIRVAALIAGLGLAISSGSRGQVVFAVFTVLVFFPIARRVANPKQFFLAGIGMVVIYGFISLIFQLFVGEINEERWSSRSMASGVGTRAELIMVLLPAWAGNPVAWVIGLGTSAFAALYYERSGYVHNIIVEVLCEHGLIALGVLFGAMYTTFQSARGLLGFRRDEPAMRATAATIAALCVYEFLLSLKQGSFIASPQFFVFWFILSKIWETEKVVYVPYQAEELDEDEEAVEHDVDAADEKVSPPPDAAPESSAERDRPSSFVPRPGVPLTSPRSAS